MGKHHSRSRGPDDVPVTDPDARLPALLLSRWWWAAPLPALALWPAAPLAAVTLTVALSGLVAAARAVVPRALAPRHGLVYVPPAALPAWREAERAEQRIRASWPSLGAMADPPDIGPALDRARYRLALLLHRRDELDRALQELRAATNGLPAGAPLRAEAHERGAEFAARRAELSDRIAERIGALRRLAEAAGDHAHHVSRSDRARDALRRAEAAAIGPEPAPDAVAELTERTEAVLAAYRELSAL
ncbi:hypothetical protein [Dactylosporangium sp. CA-139066]|uniref:hypothetical protein n=1 Tax=Dactylosporangium sp. CA-139066 TaxID=3239930 RepID=UPI003D8CF935